VYLLSPNFTDAGMAAVSVDFPAGIGWLVRKQRRWMASVALHSRLVEEAALSNPKKLATALQDFNTFHS